MARVHMDCIREEHRRHCFIVSDADLQRFENGAAAILSSRTFHHQPKTIPTVVFLGTLCPQGASKTVICQRQASYYGICSYHLEDLKSDRQKTKHKVHDDVEMERMAGVSQKLYMIELRQSAGITPMAITCVGTTTNKVHVIFDSRTAAPCVQTAPNVFKPSHAPEKQAIADGAVDAAASGPSGQSWSDLAARVEAQNLRSIKWSGYGSLKKGERRGDGRSIEYDGPYPEVKDVWDMFRWPMDYFGAADVSIGLNEALRHANQDDGLQCTVDGTGAALTRFVHNMTITKVGLGWAGVDAPGTALAMMSCQLLQYFKKHYPGKHVPDQESNAIMPTIEYAVEIDHEKKAELRLSPHAPRCMFSDYEDFWKVEIKSTINRLKSEGQKVNLNSILPLILSDRAVNAKAKCSKCNKDCIMEYVDIHVAGVSCKPFSKFGKREALESDDHMSAFGAWAGTVRYTKPKVVVFENSDRFREQTLITLFGDMYAIECLKLGGPFFGWAGKRDRIYAVMVNKEFVTGVVFSMKNVLPLFHRVLKCTFLEFLVADKDGRLGDNLADELAWASNRPTSRAQHKCDTVHDLINASSEPYYDALTFGELKFLDEYTLKGIADGRAVMLNQSEERGYGIKSSEDGILHPLIANPALHFVVSNAKGIKRWITGYEMLVCQGFPVLNELSNPCGDCVRTCSYGRLVGDNDLPQRHRKDMVVAAGDSMQVPVIGAVLCYVLLCVRFGDAYPKQKAIVGDLEVQRMRPEASDPFDSLGEIFKNKERRSGKKRRLS
ncbi:unnamed protein product [Prorocentrum cordatum]|uniref:Uncharacterized protein n=1 Tax=Prorocentrum cordatum TaxID=2364126 RepID=A0ABN9VIQ4_9DINO|nr:unnamed protein product [Polarella glacialis]